MKSFISTSYSTNNLPNLESTEACILLHEKNFRINAFWNYIIRMLSVADDISEKINDFKYKTSPLNPEEFVKGRYKWRDEYDFHESTLSEICFTRSADSFSIYLDDSLKYIFSIEPRLLRGKDKISYDEVVEKKSIKELHDLLAIKKCHSISYLGIKPRIEYLNEAIGLTFTLSEDHLKDITNIMEVRNILTHNGGYTNNLFSRKSIGLNYKDNEKITINTSVANQAASCLLEAARIIDESIVNKFTPQVVYNDNQEFAQKMAIKHSEESGKFSNQIKELLEETMRNAGIESQTKE